MRRKLALNQATIRHLGTELRYARGGGDGTHQAGTCLPHFGSLNCTAAGNSQCGLGCSGANC